LVAPAKITARFKWVGSSGNSLHWQIISTPFFLQALCGAHDGLPPGFVQRGEEKTPASVDGVIYNLRLNN
jgi:hypothetical protein